MTLAQWLRDTRTLRRKEREWAGGWRNRRPRLWLRGFLSEAPLVYDFDANGTASYLSDYARFVRTPKITPQPWRTLISSKVAFHGLLDSAGHGHLKPALLGVVHQGRFHPVGTEADSLADLLTTERAVIVKPINKGGAVGLQVYERQEGRILRNGEAVEPGQLEELTSAYPSVVERKVSQHPYAAELYPHTTNTLRVLTMVDDDGAFVAIAAQRVGSDRSYPADNWSRGGLSCHVDLDTGRLGPGATFKGRRILQWHDTHPDTDAKLTGATVPYWREAHDLAVWLSTRFGFLPYVGWDIVVAEDGPKVIEGNYWSDVNLLQAHRPLLAEPRVRRFYQRHGVI